MKTKRFFAGIIAAIILCSLMTFSVSAAVKDVNIKPNSPGTLYTIEDNSGDETYYFYFLDVYSSDVKLINAADLEGSTEFTLRFKATNATSYPDGIDVDLDIEVDENDPFGATYGGDVTLKGDGEYKISTKLDSKFKVDPNKLGIFLQLDFCGDDWPAKNQIPNIQVLEIIVKKDVADTGNTGNSGSGNTGDTGNTGNPDSTVSIDSTNPTDNPEDTDSTDSTANTENAAEVSPAEDTLNDIENDTESHSGSKTPPVVVLVIIAILLCGLASFIVVKKVKQKNKEE